MEEPPEKHAPLVRSVAAVHDIDAAINLIRKRHEYDPSVAIWLGYTAESLLGGWNRSVPVDDKASWRDPAVADAYAREALASDPETNKHKPPCFRSPNGALEDGFYLATGRQLWDASFIYVPTLVLASERDFWSRPADHEQIAHDWVHGSVKVVVIPNATHFVHLDRPERGRSQLVEEVVRFLHQN